MILEAETFCFLASPKAHAFHVRIFPPPTFISILFFAFSENIHIFLIA